MLRDQLAQRFRVRVARGQFDVHTGSQCESCGLTAACGELVHRVEEGHREVVGNRHTVEPPATPQDVGEVGGRGSRRQPVDLGVGVHDRPRSALDDRHLERRQVDIRQLARPRVHGRVIPAGLRARVADEVLECGVHSL